MEIAPEAVEVPQAAPRRSFWSADNRVVRAIGRLPLPLGAKLLIGFTLVAGLLALVAALGLIALGQSNSRGKQLKKLQQTAAYARLLAGDAAQLNGLVGIREGGGSAGGGGSGGAGGSGARAAYQAMDNDVLESLSVFAQDVSQPDIYSGSFARAHYASPAFMKKLQATLASFRDAFGEVVVNDATADLSSSPGSITRAIKIGNSARSQTTSLAEQTTRRADALVAANHGGFVHSRDLLIGVGSVSLVLALVLGLLLSWSVVAPLRRTQERLSEIAGGDFGGHVEVANRDEIGALAADVNLMNDELEGLYRELETASRHKSDFLATMSHELRTPLNAIIGFSEVLHEEMFGKLNDRQRAYVEDVMSAGRHLLSLINDVLDLAKIEAGRMELELSQVEVPELLRSAVSMHAEGAGRRGIHLALQTEPEEIAITADDRRVRQIVFNLLSNAIKFAPPDGRVDISARLDDGHIEIAVSDTGPGIPAEDQRTIFEEFEQASDGKQAEEGTGLGLPLSRKLVELHGGRLWVESEVGRGSTFRFTLPVEASA
jgi:signal transduction histidine kinase